LEDAESITLSTEIDKTNVNRLDYLITPEVREITRKQKEEIKYNKEQQIISGCVAYLELKLERFVRLPKEINEMQLLRYFDPKLEKIISLKEIKNNIGASTGRYAVFFKDSLEASKFVQRFDNDYFNTEELNIPLKAYVY
jgi:hypothetical protein